MKNTNEMSRVVRYIVSAPSFQTAKRRYDALKQMASTLHQGDTFISDDVSDFIDYMSLGSMVIDMQRRCLNIIDLETRRGRVIRDERGRAIGKTSCNVYRMEYDPEKLMKELASVRDAIGDMFD